MSEIVRSYFRALAEDREQGLLSSFLKPVLGAAALGYGSASGMIRRMHERKILTRKKFPFPVLSVGNLTWGGTGKTPLVEYLARRLSDRGRVPLILTRGYSHDEIHQIQHHLPRVRFGVGKNRIKAAEKALREAPVDVAILDDGMQHWAVERDLDVVTVNALNPFGNEKLIPRGILREPLTALTRAGIIMISNANLLDEQGLKDLKKRISDLAPKALVVESYMEPLFFYRAKKRQRVSIERLARQKVTTFSAVGAPRSFQLTLSHSQIKPIRNFEFTDHHRFTRGDLLEIKKVSESAEAQEIITTEKDYYRSPKMIAETLNPLILATRLRISSGEEILNDRLFRLLGVKG